MDMNPNEERARVMQNIVDRRNEEFAAEATPRQWKAPAPPTTQPAQITDAEFAEWRERRHIEEKRQLADELLKERQEHASLMRRRLEELNRR